MNKLLSSIKNINSKTIGYEILLWVLLFGIFFSDLAIINNILPYDQVMPTALELNDEIVNQGGFMGLDEELKSRMESDVVLVKSFFVKMTALIIISTLLIITAISLTRGRIYSIVLHKKFNKKSILTILWKNALWMTAWTIILIIGIVSLKPAGFTFLAPFFIILYLHFITLIRYSIIENKKIVIDTGIKQIHKFLLPMLACTGIIIVTLFISIALLPYLFNKITAIMPSYQAFFGITMLLTIAGLTVFTIIWIREYYIAVIKNLTNTKSKK